MTDRKTILFAPASNILFHVVRCLELAKELKLRGHRIIFVGTRLYLQDPVVTAGKEFEYYELPDFAAEEALGILRSIGQIPSKRVLLELIEAELQALNKLKPDLVVADFRLTSYISARVCGVPLVSLLLSVWMQQYFDRSASKVSLSTYPQLILLKKFIGRTGIMLLTPLLLRLIIWYKMRPFQTVAKLYGQAPRRMLWDLLVGDCNLLLDTEAWSPTKPLPPHFRRVGPIFWEPDLPLPQWVSQLDPTQPVIYICFGSTAHKDLFRTIFSEFAATRYQVIVVTGGQIDPQEFHIPPNFYVEKFLPGKKIMEHADLVIYHGGAGTAYQVMKAGIPSIVIATHLDQEYQGTSAEGHQVGICLTMLEVLANPGSILQATERLVRNLTTYQESSKKLQNDLLRYDGPIAAADCIEDFIRERRL
jgi:UDP:flavonoid glycosyltransferase YjiC (YdhE family)